MSMRSRIARACSPLAAAAALLVSACVSQANRLEEPMAATLPVAEPVAIWSGRPPGRPEPALAESHGRQSQGWRDITVVKNVAVPTLSAVRPTAGSANGAAMIILPGGAFAALAWDLEGLEVAQFLAERGITAFVLKYRVRDGTPEMMQKYLANPTFETLLELQADNRAEAVEDAKQAVRYLRKHSDTLGIDPNRIGMMGFSAGAMTTMSALHAADDEARPDIAAAIYGAMVETSAPADAPPIFVAVANDDTTTQPGMSTNILAAWQATGAPVELHVFETGEHGFGLGRPGTASTAWPRLFEAWLNRREFITQE